jgi:hypothetical protein
MPRSVLITTATLVVLAALGGFWLGQRQVTLDTTGIINTVAARHVAEHGGAVTDCLGWPGEGAVVFQVKCGDVTYHVDRLGRVARAPEGGL